MKKHLVSFSFIALIMIPGMLVSQTSEPVSYTGVVEVSGMTKDQLFANARQWFNKTFVSSNQVIQIADKESGELSGKGIMQLRFTSTFNGSKKQEAYSDFTLDIAIKDGKYKYDLSQFKIYPIAYRNQPFPLYRDNKCPVKYSFIRQSAMDEYYASSKDAVSQKVTELVTSLKIAMEKKSDIGF
ncbi:DUF4468 domain-containing protein [Flavitalea antarctica]